MSELSRKLRESRAKASQGEWYEFQEDDDMFMGASGVYCDSPADRLHDADAPDHGDINPNITICLTLLQSPRAASHRDYNWEANTEFIIDAANSIDDLCNEVESLERENAALRAQLVDSANETDAIREQIEAVEKENAALRAELETLRANPVSVLDAACRSLGIPLADDHEKHVKEWRAYLNAPVADNSDSALYRAIADDPKAYPPEKH